MIDGSDFVDALERSGFDFFTGVPCSLLGAPIHALIQRNKFISATNEAEALSLAFGAALSGRLPVVLAQNSGLGNMVNGLTSLTGVFRRGALLIVSLRGAPEDNDEPQHLHMGRITTDLLDLLDVRWEYLSGNPHGVVSSIIDAACRVRSTGASYAFVVRRDIFARSKCTALQRPRRDFCSVVGRFGSARCDVRRIDAIRAVTSVLPQGAVVVATTGKCGRELYATGDRDRYLYTVGAMGSASSIAAALSSGVNRSVFVLDGDGAALMRLGSLATNGLLASTKFVHLLLDNGVHDSTGGQPTASQDVNFAEVAAACGYRSSFRCDTIDSLHSGLEFAARNDGPHFIHLRIRAGSEPSLPRPALHPAEIAQRFTTFVSA